MNIFRLLFGCMHVYDPIVTACPLRILRYECSRCGDVTLPKDGVKEFEAIADHIWKGEAW
jgi:hypothetical protein